MKYKKELEEIIDTFDACIKYVKQENKIKMCGNSFVPELLVKRINLVKIEIRKENPQHNIPHFHVSHSDKIDASLSIIDFGLLAGRIDQRTYQLVKKQLYSKKEKLLTIWNELNEKENSICISKLIEEF